MSIVENFQYSAEHEWVDGSTAGSVRVGITSVAADALGDIVYVDLPEAGATITAGQVCGEIESTKSVSDLYAPVSGEILEINEALSADPAVINTDPYGAGWLFTVAVSAPGELMSAAEYAALNGVSL